MALYIETLPLHILKHVKHSECVIQREGGSEKEQVIELNDTQTAVTTATAATKSPTTPATTTTTTAN